MKFFAISNVTSYFILFFSVCSLAYIIGSIPFSYLVAKIFKGIDIRKHGSGNVGATNVFRTCGKFYGFLAFALDSFKAGIVFFVFSRFFPFMYLELATILGFATIIGHCYSVFLKLKGGKGVACATGLLFFIDPLLTLALMLVFIAIIYFTSYVSLASMVVVLLAPLFYFVMHNNLSVSAILLCLGLFIIYRHKSNIIRLKNGTENKVRLSKK